MVELPRELRDALEAEEGGPLLELLRRRRPTDFEALRSLLSLDATIPSDFRTKAIYALGQWGDPSVVSEIRQLAGELDERGRIGAVSALGHLGTAEATEGILERANDPAPQVRKAVVLALGRTDTPEAAAKLREIASREAVPWIRELAARRVR